MNKFKAFWVAWIMLVAIAMFWTNAYCQDLTPRQAKILQLCEVALDWEFKNTDPSVMEKRVCNYMFGFSNCNPNMSVIQLYVELRLRACLAAGK